MILHFRNAGCERIYIDGSFVTIRERPGDYDVCWDEETTDDALLDPIFQNFDRNSQKKRYKGEAFPSLAIASLQGLTYLSYFQRDRQLNPKGIILIDTGDVPA